MTYFYPQVVGGYRWNMLQRCLNEVGIEPIDSGDTSGQTYLAFSRELTLTEKIALDLLMLSNPTFPPANTGKTTYEIKDIWETRQQFSVAVGGGVALEFFIYYTESVPGSGSFDRIQLHFKKALSASERNKVADEQSKLMSLKQIA
jgi:hypothetical protein